MSVFEIVSIFAVLLTSLGGSYGLTLLLNFRANNRKLQADADVAEANVADIITGASARVVKDLRYEVDAYKGQVRELNELLGDARAELGKLTATLEAEREASRREIVRLRSRIVDLGGEVDWH